MNRILTLSLLALALAACRNDGDSKTDTGIIDTGTVTDGDGDGSPAGEDCDDGDASVFPGAEEVCNGQDDNCDGVVDEGVTTTWYADSDGDGYGDANVMLEACEQPSGYLADASDCDDDDGDVNPAAAELCNGIDDNCDGFTDPDDAVDAVLWYADADEDGFGDGETGVAACEQPSGSVADGSDCDDTDQGSYPGADEICDERDNDCDGTVDEQVTTTFWADMDGDGHGALDQTTDACALPVGYAVIGDDCDDDDAAVNPAATEVCNGADDDCDGYTDPDDAADAATWYLDADGDGYGGAATTTVACTPPSGYLADDTDCDDDDGAIFPESDGTCVEGYDCLTIVGTAADTGTGLYTIDPDGSGAGDAPFEAYCDMDTDGGGWTLVMRCIEDYIDYEDAVWESTTLLDETSYDFAAAGCSKYAAYNVIPFRELRTSYPTDLSNDFVEDLGTEYSSALTLFSSTGWQIGTYYDYFNDMMDPFAQEWGCTTYRSYGINQKDYLGTSPLPGGAYCDWNGGARWGQRVNADNASTGNHAGQGWGAYSTIAYEWSWAISQLLWVR